MPDVQTVANLGMDGLLAAAIFALAIVFQSFGRRILANTAEDTNVLRDAREIVQKNRDQYDALAKRVEDVSADLMVSRIAQARLESAHDATKEQLATASHTITNQAAQIGQLQGLLQSAADARRALETENADLRNRNKALLDEINSMQAKIRRHQEEISRLQGRINQLENKTETKGGRDHDRIE